MSWKLELTWLGGALHDAWWLGFVGKFLVYVLPHDWLVKEFRQMTPEEQEAHDRRKSMEGKRMTFAEAKKIWRKHGGGQHGPRVETYTIPEQSWMAFVEELIEKSKEGIKHKEGSDVEG